MWKYILKHYCWIFFLGIFLLLLRNFIRRIRFALYSPTPNDWKRSKYFIFGYLNYVILSWMCSHVKAIKWYEVLFYYDDQHQFYGCLWYYAIYLLKHIELEYLMHTHRMSNGSAILLFFNSMGCKRFTFRSPICNLGENIENSGGMENICF